MILSGRYDKINAMIAFIEKYFKIFGEYLNSIVEFFGKVFISLADLFAFFLDK
jgi:hypothetical protein